MGSNMDTTTDEYVEVVMLDVCAFMQWGMYSMQNPGCHTDEYYRFVAWSQLQLVLDVMEAALTLFGPEVNVHYDYLQLLRADWIELMESFRAMVSLEDGSYYLLDYIDDAFAPYFY